ncbi:MAG: TonB-dependent receptor plug domain-containing protein, partial [Cyanobacteria bacterium P01_C01_bin.120]
MDKWLPGLSLLTLITVVSGQGAQAQALTGQFASELEETGAIDVEAAEQSGLAPAVDPLSSADSLSSSLPTSADSSPSPQTATTVTEWLAQTEASVVQITDLQVESTEAGLQILIEADGALATPTQSTSGNALMLTIPNAALTEEFQVFEPAEGIALVQAIALPGNVVQVAITGNDAVPDININTEATGLVLGVTPGIAQVGTEDDAIQIGVTGEDGSRYVEPTATTGTRTDTPLRDIPQSIQVIPQAVLEDQQVTDLADALRNVSGVTPSRSGNDGTGLRLNVRGFEDASVLRDGFRLTFGGNGAISSQDLSNIEQIEVLKGPAAILFGVTEPGGVVNLVTEQPLSEPFYELGFRGGNRGLINPTIDISGPLTEDRRLLYRLNAAYSTEDYFRDFETDIERFFFAPVVSGQINENTNLT